VTDALFAALNDWIATALPTVKSVVKARQKRGDAPAGERPCVVLRISTDVGIGGTTHKRTSNTPGTVDPNQFQQAHTMPRQKTLVVDIYGDGALALAGDLEISVNFPDVIQQFLAAGISVTHAGGLGDTTGLRPTGYEPSAQVEFYVAQNQQATVEVPAIETVNQTIT
jgi:hypothetical protein